MTVSYKIAGVTRRRRQILMGSTHLQPPSWTRDVPLWMETEVALSSSFSTVRTEPYGKISNSLTFPSPQGKLQVLKKELPLAVCQMLSYRHCKSLLRAVLPSVSGLPCEGNLSLWYKLQQSNLLIWPMERKRQVNYKRQEGQV